MQSLVRHRRLRHLPARLHLLLRDPGSGDCPITPPAPPNRLRHAPSRGGSCPVAPPMGLDLSRIRIVLVEPRVPENIGMAARAMKNCGVSRLVLVRPVEHLSAAACRPAMEAYPLLQSAEVHPRLDEAIQGSRMIVGATRRGGQDRHPLLTPSEWIREVLPRAEGQEVSILFGAEKDGLSTEATDRCDVLLRLPAHPDYGSFNLAQAVLLVSYELFRASEHYAAAAKPLDLATDKEREEFFVHLESLLLTV